MYKNNNRIIICLSVTTYAVWNHHGNKRSKYKLAMHTHSQNHIELARDQDRNQRKQRQQWHSYRRREQRMATTEQRLHNTTIRERGQAGGAGVFYLGNQLICNHNNVSRSQYK